MIRSKILLILLLVAVVTFAGSFAIVRLARGPGSDGGLTVEGPAAYDFGVLDEGVQIVHEFKLRNTGKSEVIIQDVSASCSCTEATISSRNIAPNASAVVTVAYRGRSIATRDAADVAIVSSDAIHPLIHLTLTGWIRLAVFWTPPGITFSGATGAKLEKDVVFRSDHSHLKILNPICSSDRIMASLVRDYDGRYLCHVELSPDCPAGNWTESVKLHAVIDDFERDILIDVNVRLR
jgi:hypothetical protein